MNRLNQTEPATFSILLFWDFFMGSIFYVFYISNKCIYCQILDILLEANLCSFTLGLKDFYPKKWSSLKMRPTTATKKIGLKSNINQTESDTPPPKHNFKHWNLLIGMATLTNLTNTEYFYYVLDHMVFKPTNVVCFNPLWIKTYK